MANKSQGINKRIAFKKETNFGELAGDTGAKVLRRISADFNLKKESYESAELRNDYMTADLRHGPRSADGSLSAELSPGSYSEFIGSILARDFAAVSPGAATSVTIATSGVYFTVTRSTGSWLTDGIKVGNVVRLTGAGLNTANVGNNLLVISMSATVLTVKVLSDTALVAEGPIATVTATVTGKTSYIPLTGHVDNSYNVEQWYADIAQSEVFTGIKVGSVDIKVPVTGITTADFSFTGKDLTQSGTSAYFTSPTAASTNGLLTSVQGALLFNGAEGACITDANIKVERDMTPTQCIGTNSSSDIFVGKIKITGSFSAYFSDATFRNYFDDETVVSLVLAITSGVEKAADFVTITLPKIKLSNFSNKDDAMGITSSIDFTALLNDVTTAGLINSAILVQDSQA